MRVGNCGRRVHFAPVVLLAGVLAVLVFGAGVASASTTVNCNAVGGSAAFQAALGVPGTVFVSGTCDGTFTVTANVTVTGSPSATLDGQGAGSTLKVFPGHTVTLNNLTVTGGNSPDVGGGIGSIKSTLTLNNCLVTGNTAADAGGGIVSGANPGPPGGMLTLNSTRVTDNVVLAAPGNGGGGGILNHNGTAVLNNSVVSGNSAQGGGGIANGNGGSAGAGGTMTITGSVVSGNSATGGPPGGAGGIANGGTLTLTNSTVSGNQAVGGVGGGILNHGVATISGSAINGNLAPDDNSGDQGNGGGIFNANFGVPGTGQLTITNSQVTRNQSGLGGGIFSGAFGGDASLQLTSTDVSLNIVKGAQSGGGGIANISGDPGSGGGNAVLTMSGSTLVGNLARQGLGGAIANVSQGADASTSIVSTTIGSTRLQPPYSLNPNQAEFGGGIFNWAMQGPADVTLGTGAVVVGNQAFITGGGVFNADGATLTVAGGLVLLNHPNNIVNDPTF